MKKLIVFLLIPLIAAALALGAVCEERVPRVIDGAELFTDSERAKLEEQIEDFADAHAFDIVIVTANGIGGKTPVEYADDYFDYNGYGIGEGRDGMLFLLDMQNRDWYVGTSGIGTKIYDSDFENAIINKSEVITQLSQGNLYNSFDEFIKLADKFYREYSSGGSYVYDENEPVIVSPDEEERDTFTFEEMLPLCIGAVIFGLVVGFIRVTILKSQMRTAKKQTNAEGYVVPGSFRLTRQSDNFLYAHETRVKIETDTPKVGGGTHISSSGRSHGGFGGKF